jgi:hypothetical protein
MVRAMLLSLIIAVAPPAQRSTHDVLYAAIIAASAAIVGGLIGGSIPGYFMLKAEDKRHKHARQLAEEARDDERERERRAVVGTARALSEFFERIPIIFTVGLNGGHWWSDTLDGTILPPSLEDQKAVFGQLTSGEATLVASCMRALELIRTERSTAIEFHGPTAPLDDDNKRHLQSGCDLAQSASRSLGRVAELPA